MTRPAGAARAARAPRTTGAARAPGTTGAARAPGTTGAARAAVARPYPALLAALLLLAALAGLAVQPASAARLELTAARITTGTAAPCASTSLAAAPAGTGATRTQVVLADVPVGCRGRAATVRLYAADGAPLAAADTAVTLADAPSSTVAVPGFEPARVGGVAITVGTWAVPATWSGSGGSAPAAGPVTPGPGTTFGAVTWSQVASSGTQACATVPVTAAPGSAWRVDLHVEQRPFNGVASGAGFVVSPWYARVLDAAPVDGVLRVGPAPGSADAGRPVTVTVCHYDLPAPRYDAALAYPQTTGEVTGSAYRACLPVTVAVSGTPELYAGWRADVDVAPLVAYVAARGRTADLRTVAVGGNYAVTALGGGVHRVVPTGWDTWGVRDDSPRAFEVCVRS